MAQILIVDDDAGIREILRRLLAETECAIEEASNAEQALDCVTERPPDVVFCDVHMPGASGLWLADQIRLVSPTTAMVLATGNAGVSPLDSLRAGVVAYLIKPFNRYEVVEAAEEGLRWSAQARGERDPPAAMSGTSDDGSNEGL